MDEIWFFLPGIIALGIITSYEDWKQGKIRNKWVALGLGYAGALTIALMAWQNLGRGYALETFSDFVFAIAVGFGLWYAKVWTAGDGKLFIAYAAMMPLGAYPSGYIPFIPSATLLMNMFIIGGGAFILLLLLTIRKKEAWALMRAFIVSLPRRLGIAFLFIFSTSWALSAFTEAAGISLPSLGKMAVMFVIFAAAGRSRGAIAAAALISILRVFMDPGAVSGEQLMQTLLTAIIWQCVLFLASETVFLLPGFTKRVKAKDLREGMMLKDWQERDKAERDGLTSREISDLKKGGKREFLVSRTVPFAPIMALGVITTILAKGNLLIVLRGLLGWG